MKCPYPDCVGEVREDEQFCGECGRSLAANAVASAVAGMATRGGPPVVPATAAVPDPAPFVPVARPMSPPLAPSNRMPLILAGSVGLVLLLAVACLAGVYLVGPPATPTPGVAEATLAPGIQITYQLANLTQANNFRASRPVQGADGQLLGTLTLAPGHSYRPQGAAQLISTIEIRLDNALVLELAATDDPSYAETNPQYEVAQVGRTYDRTTSQGWPLRATVDAVSIKERPALPNRREGGQAIFTSLSLTLDLHPTP